ncbi:GGDEF domain-containing protein [Nocardioides nematodiphilus]|uniref:GGDEF domain-containing protein n=1 Tax=Nocardioides nematodiphilus TaxID=2849669 RepID=UPI001CD9A122|nr:GGDEF domain-containing protein [Nocardioides nematodiphilus]MCA1983826.1 GGDEF domain-containing protein [Nocardioides nematodiphilus]
MSNLPLWHRRGAIGVLVIATCCLLACFSTHEADGFVPIYYVVSVASVIVLWALVGRSRHQPVLLAWPLAVMLGMAGASFVAPMAATLCMSTMFVAFLFAGLTQTRGISLIMLPPAVFTYLLVFADLPVSQLSVKLATSAVVWVAVSEAPAWLAGDLRAARTETERLAATDPLTGLANRRHWDERLPQVLEAGPSGVVLLIDLDHFKHFNDAHGHLAGDDMLVAFARTIEDALPETALAARWGGEEFAVAVGDRVEARAVADAIRASVPLAQTCSIGMAEHRPGEATVELIQRADDALYAAKSHGRDRIVAA